MNTEELCKLLMDAARTQRTVDYPGWADRTERAANTIARQSATIKALTEALQWMVDNDDTNEGETTLPEHGGHSWNEINAYWIAGLNRARAALAQAREEE